MSKIDRRQLLTAAPAAGFAALVAGAAPVQAMAETPVTALFREWTAARAAEELAYQTSEEDAEGEKAWSERVRIENLMLATPSQGHADWMLKICAYSAFGEGGAPDIIERPDLWAEARALVGA